MTSTKTLRPPVTSNGDGRRPMTPSASRSAPVLGRNRTRVVGGVLLMAASALVAALLYASLGDRHAVLTVVQPVTAGQVIEPADLGESLVSVDATEATVEAERLDDIVGRVAAVDLVAGSLLADQQVADAPVAPSGEAVVGAVLAPGAFPLDLRRGDRVIAILVPADAAHVESPGGAVRSAPATVVAVEDQTDSGGGIAVSLAVSPDGAGDLSVGGAQGRLTLVLAPR